MMSAEDIDPTAEETSLGERVRAYLLMDVSMSDALCGGIANLARTARKLKAENGWDDQEEEIVRVLREYVEEAPPVLPQQSRRLLEETHFGSESSLALLTVPDGAQVRDRLEDMGTILANSYRGSIIQGNDKLRLVLDMNIVDEVRELLPAEVIRDEKSPLAAVNLELPEHDEAVCVVGCMVAAFQRHGIPVLQVSADASEGWILVPEEHELDAGKVADALTKG